MGYERLIHFFATLFGSNHSGQPAVHPEQILAAIDGGVLVFPRVWAKETTCNPTSDFIAGQLGQAYPQMRALIEHKALDQSTCGVLAHKPRRGL